MRRKSRSVSRRCTRLTAYGDPAGEGLGRNPCHLLRGGEHLAIGTLLGGGEMMDRMGCRLKGEEADKAHHTPHRHCSVSPHAHPKPEDGDETEQRWQHPRLEILGRQRGRGDVHRGRERKRETLKDGEKRGTICMAPGRRRRQGEEPQEDTKGTPSRVTTSKPCPKGPCGDKEIMLWYRWTKHGSHQHLPSSPYTELRLIIRHQEKNVTYTLQVLRHFKRSIGQPPSELTATSKTAISLWSLLLGIGSGAVRE